MRRVGLEDLMGHERYASVRDQMRRDMVVTKQSRRVTVGECVSLVFENFETVRFQIQEMIHVERITDIDKIREECEVYNDLIPGAGELSATLFIEITDPTRIEHQLNQLVGIDEHVHLVVGEHRLQARFEPGRSREDKISAVQYVRFGVDAAASAAFGMPGTPLRVEIDHPSYRASATLGEGHRASLALDLRA